MRKVTLAPYKEEYYNQLNEFNLPEDQARFTGIPTEIINITHHKQYPIVILDNDEPAGIFLLHSTERVKDYSDNPNAMLLTALSVHHTKQGQGIAKRGMDQLKNYVTRKFPHCNEIVLAVNHKNLPAQKLYEKVGFKDTGKRKKGRIGEQYILNSML